MKGQLKSAGKKGAKIICSIVTAVRHFSLFQVMYVYVQYIEYVHNYSRYRLNHPISSNGGDKDSLDCKDQNRPEDAARRLRVDRVVA